MSCPGTRRIGSGATEQGRLRGAPVLGVQAARIVFPPADRAEIAAAITGILTTGALTLGPYTKQFEEAFAEAHEAAHAVAVASGTAALEISLRAGGRPVFADIDAATFALSPDTITAALTPDTAAVVLVHIAGLISPHADEIRLLCEQRGITLVEDAAHAHGATYDGRFAGSFGAAAAFSFYPTKVVTSGEGGMIVSPSGDLADEARIYRDQGKGAFSANHHVRLGYDRALAGLDGLEPLSEPAGCRGNIYKYIVLLPPGADRAAFKRELAEKHEVRLAGEVYDPPLHHQPVLADFAGGALPVAEAMCDRHVCLPVHSDMRDDEVDQVLTAVAAVYDALPGV